ncbi:MAG TPA: VIT1/CCC1 transporter family protein [Gaiellaceae bacterium]|nr:VIT1/CCC1 transporter family protein [Gaiellaceae bacterium]
MSVALPPGRDALSHPRGTAALRAHTLSERARLSRFTRIREFVLGFQDGLLVPLGVVTGLAGAAIGTTAVIVGGVAEAAAGALAMGTGAYLSSHAENSLIASEIADQEAEVVDHPDLETLELQVLFEEEGLSAEDARTAARAIGRSPHSLAKTKIEKELGLPFHDTETAIGDALVVGASYAIAAVIPLWPYFFFGMHVAMALSLVATGLALFALGVVKGRVARLALLRSGLQVLVVGALSAGVGYLIGGLGPRLF